MQENLPAEVCVFGLGSMGYGIASSLVRAGCATRGFDLDANREADLQAEGGLALERDAALANAGAVVIVVVNAAQTEGLLFGENGIAAHLRAGVVVISCATMPPDTARAFEARLAETGVLYLDAPISGGSAKAAKGQLTYMAAGRPESFAAAQNVLDATSERVFKLGDAAGPGSAMKVVNQMLAGIHIAAAAEAMTFGITQGIEPKTTLEVISECAGTSWMFENRGPHIAEGDYTPHSAVDIFVKDLGIVCDIAHGAKFSAPVSATALQQFVAASGAGFGRDDDSAVAKIYARNAGVKLPGEET